MIGIDCTGGDGVRRAPVPVAGAFTLTFIWQFVAPRARYPPDNWIKGLPEVAATAPPQVLLTSGVGATVKPAPIVDRLSVSDKLFKGESSPPAWLIVIVSRDTPLGMMVVGEKLLATVISSVVVRFAVAAFWLFPRLVTSPPAGTVFVRVATTSGVFTGTMITQFPFATIVPPVRLIVVVPGVAVSVPPHDVEAAGLAATLYQSVGPSAPTPIVVRKSLNEVMEALLPLPFARVMVKVVVFSSTNVDGLKAFATVTGLPSTVSTALPPL